MSILYCLIFLGHLTGNYLTQTSNIIANKSKAGSIAFKACIIHSFVYTITILWFLSMGEINLPIKKILLFSISIFVFHFVINKYNIIAKYVEKFKISIWNNDYYRMNLPYIKDIPNEYNDNLNLIIGIVKFIIIENTLYLLFLTLLMFVIKNS